PNSNNPENSLTAEAINIARAASGTDEATKKNPNATSSPNGSPTPTPSPATNLRTNYGFTGNSSPVFDAVNDAGSNGNANQQQNGSGNQQPEKAANLTTPAPMQNHANSTQSIVVEDVP